MGEKNSKPLVVFLVENDGAIPESEAARVERHGYRVETAEPREGIDWMKDAAYAILYDRIFTVTEEVNFSITSPTKIYESVDDMFKCLGIIEVTQEDGKDVDSSEWARQVGGDHYKRYAMQPSQYIYRNGIDWLRGNAIKYITRCQDKGTERADIEKAMQYLQFYLEERDRDRHQ